jgi:transcriptional regulator with XRE-family HTH domain
MKKPQWAINLKKARKQANLTQEDVAAMISKSRETYSKYESGEIEPSLETWFFFFDYYQILDPLKFFLKDYYPEQRAA